MNNFYEFIQWCFRDEIAGITTIIILGMLTEFIIRVTEIIVKRHDRN